MDDSLLSSTLASTCSVSALPRSPSHSPQLTAASRRRHTFDNASAAIVEDATSPEPQNEAPAWLRANSTTGALSPRTPRGAPQRISTASLRPSSPFPKRKGSSASAASNSFATASSPVTASTSTSSLFKGFTPKRTPISLQFQDVCLILPDGTKVLDSLTGAFPHSRLSAILGPSGSGKTSFLCALAGRASYATMTGTIKINHIETNIHQLKSLCGFVPQDDILHADLTVHENLFYNAMLRLPRAMALQQKLQIVEDVISMLGLSHVRHSLVGDVNRRGISGGQRKRVNIGCELVSSPSLLFLDEATSGLDASCALEVLSSLRNLADLGLTIITVIHQPRYSIFSSFHTVLFLGQGGKTTFLGRAEDAMPYFENLGFVLPEHENPADFLMDVISGVVRERRVIDEDTHEAKIITVPIALNTSDGNTSNGVGGGSTVSFAHRESFINLPSLDLLPTLSAPALSRALSQSQPLKSVASLIIDLGDSHQDDDIYEPVLDFHQCWIDHQNRVELAKRARRESRASPDQRPRSTSNASSTTSNHSASTPTASFYAENSSDETPSFTSSLLHSSFANKIKAFISRAERARQRRLKMEMLYHEFAQEFIEENEDDNENGRQGDEGDEKSLPPPDYSAAYDSYLLSSATPTASSLRTSSSSRYPCLPCSSSSSSSQAEWGQDLSTSLLLDSTDESSASATVPSTQHMQLTSTLLSHHTAATMPRDRQVFGLPKIEPSPTVFTQYGLLSRRLSLKLLRNWTYAIVDMFLVAFLSITVGIVYGSEWTLGQYTSQSVFSTLCMGVCATVASLRIFGSDRLNYWRETLVGVSETAYYLSLMTVELHRAFIYPAIFVACYAPLAKPQASFTSLYFVFVAVYFAMSGLGLLLSVLCRPVTALMVGTMLPLVIGGFLNGVNPPVNEMSPLMALLSNISFTRWSVEALGMCEAAFVLKYGADDIYWWQRHFGFVDQYWYDIFALVVTGLAFRAATALALRRFSKRHKA